MARKGTIDTVRGIGILAVIMVHSGQSATPDPGIPVTTVEQKFLSFTGTGMFGVQVFFCISGYLLFMLYRSTEVSTASYWVRRIARLWPLWAAFVFIGLAVPAFRPDLVGDSYVISALISLAFMGWLFAPQLSNFPIGGWSIVAEMAHYTLFWPMRKLSPFLLIGTILIGYLIKDAVDFLRQFDQPDFTQWLLDGLWTLDLWNTWPYFLIGGIVYLLTASSDTRQEVIASMGRPIGLILGILVIAFLQINGQMAAIGSVIGFIIIAFIADFISPVAAAVRSIGRVSYFMYFMHFYVLYVASLALRRVFKAIFGPGSYPEPILAFFILATTAVIVSWAIGQLSWRFFESPINRRAQQFHTRFTSSTSKQPAS